MYWKYFVLPINIIHISTISNKQKLKIRQSFILKFVNITKPKVLDGYKRVCLVTSKSLLTAIIPSILALR
jgi:hypothetical protein